MPRLSWNSVQKGLPQISKIFSGSDRSSFSAAPPTFRDFEP
jgi:hypothetical protein